jgi:hypothetical protein
LQLLINIKLGIRGPQTPLDPQGSSYKGPRPVSTGHRGKFQVEANLNFLLGPSPPPGEGPDGHFPSNIGGLGAASGPDPGCTLFVLLPDSIRESGVHSPALPGHGHDMALECGVGWGAGWIPRRLKSGRPPGAPTAFPEGGGQSDPPSGKVFEAPGVVQTPKIDGVLVLGGVGKPTGHRRSHIQRQRPGPNTPQQIARICWATPSRGEARGAKREEI